MENKESLEITRNPSQGSVSGSADFTQLEKDLMLKIAEYEAEQCKLRFGRDDIETRLIEIIAISTGGRLELSR
jgi:hypothetical protein